jgi:tRNA(Arg) A34 adenosine deaminase TadA
MNMKNAKKFIELAITEAEKSSEPLPCGAVIVCKDKVISKDFNKQRSIPDATAHAEINAIRKACDILGTKNLAGCSIYCSCEPCLMCLNAIVWAKIDTVHYAVSLLQATNNSPKNFNISSEEFVSKGPLSVSLIGGILEKEAKKRLYS